MKKFLIFFIALFVVLFLVSCGSNKNAANQSVSRNVVTQKAAVTKKIKKVTPTLTIKIGEKETTYKPITVVKTGSEGDKGFSYIVSTKSDESGKVAVSLEFTYDPTTKEISHPSISIRGYKVLDKTIMIEEFKTEKDRIGRKRLVGLKLSFNGEVQKRDNMGFPRGDKIKFSGNVIYTR